MAFSAKQFALSLWNIRGDCQHYFIYGLWLKSWTFCCDCQQVLQICRDDCQMWLFVLGQFTFSLWNFFYNNYSCVWVISLLQVCKRRQHESAGLQHATNMNQEFKNSTCSESTRARYENEIPLRHHLVNIWKIILKSIILSYYLGKQERMKLERVNPACRPYSQGFTTIITGKLGTMSTNILRMSPMFGE